MKNRDVFAKDPLKQRLVNNGVAEVVDATTKEQLDTLRHELETFVCEKQYARGLERILEAFVSDVGKEEQRPVWVSGFFGSGKSHLVKMLRALWTDFKFSDGVSARGLGHLPKSVLTPLKELSTLGKRFGGLHACSGTLGASAAGSIRLAVLSVVFRSAGLPETFPAARFVLFLKKNGYFEKVKKTVEEAGREFEKELRDLYVSPVLGKALLETDPNFAPSESAAKLLLREQFPKKDDVSDDEMVAAIHEALDVDGKLPLTLLVLDEVQQWVGEDTARSAQVNNLAECCAKRFSSRLLLVATGQTALSGTPALQKLQDRLPTKIELSDADVETVIRTIVLAKLPDKRKALDAVLEEASGEISRHLHGTKLEVVPEDDDVLAVDYPLLPVRRRFWEKVLRAVDRAGTSGQLRTQLRIVHEAVQSTAEKPLGTVVPGDFVFDQISTELVRTGVLLHEIHERIARLNEGGKDGRLKARLAALVFLISRLSREGAEDTGVRATPEALTDLLVEDLVAGRADLAARVPGVLDSLVSTGALQKVGDEYRLQTRDGSAWDGEYRERLGKIQADEQKIAGLRSRLLEDTFRGVMSDSALLQGKSKVRRPLEVAFGLERPKTGAGIPVWIRDGWNEEEKAVVAEVQSLGTGDPLVVVFLQRLKHEELKRGLASREAAQETLHVKGLPTTDEGREARKGMETLRDRNADEVDRLVSEIIDDAKVYLAGIPTPRENGELGDTVRKAADDALIRLYQRFHEGDDPRWEQVFTRAKGGAPDALKALGHDGAIEKHPVTAALLSELGPGRKGAELRKYFTTAPFGWPQDTVDGALMALVAAGRVSATLQGTLVGVSLDRTKIGVAEFRPEHPVLSTEQKIALRKLFTDAGLDGKPLGEQAAAPKLIDELRRRAEAAGGDPPLPERPATAFLSEISSLSGNDLLSAIYERREQLSSFLKDWKKRGESIALRSPGWELLLRLLRHAEGLPVEDEIKAQVAAIRAGRRLLEEPDHVPALTAQLTGALRVEIAKAVSACKERYERERAALEKSEAWAKVDPAVQDRISAEKGLQPVTDPAVGTAADVLASLDRESLAAWGQRFHALQSRFADSLGEAARILDPKAIRVSLLSATLKSEGELDVWLAETRRRISERLKDGPVLV
jgi:hypothetical protein